MFNKYYEIKSVYERENKETKENEVVVICNEIKWKWIVTSYTQFFVFTPMEFASKFWSEVKKDQRNFGLERLPLEVWVKYEYEVHWINRNLPDNLK